MKIRNADLICIVDVSGSMSYYNKINLVRESLTYLVNMMANEDKLAIVAFNDVASTRLDLKEMNEKNKVEAINAINGLEADGYSNILEGLIEGLKHVEDVYFSEERVVSMILISDLDFIEENTYINFDNYINIEGKQNIPFTLHVL